MKNIFLGLMVSALVVACSSDKGGSPNIEEQQLVGQWEWATIGGHNIGPDNYDKEKFTYSFDGETVYVKVADSYTGDTKYGIGPFKYSIEKNVLVTHDTKSSAMPDYRIVSVNTKMLRMVILDDKSSDDVMGYRKVSSKASAEHLKAVGVEQKEESKKE